MKEYTKDDLKAIYKSRVMRLASYLKDSNLGSCVFIDTEEHRDPALPYFTGHPTDAVLIIYSDGYSILIPWDEILARKTAVYDKMIPLTKFKNSNTEAVKTVLNSTYTHGLNSRVELPPYLTYLDYLKFIDSLEKFDCRCSEDGAHAFTKKCRFIKDKYEIDCTKEAARIGDLIIDKIENEIKKGKIKTETDVALLIERECRVHGCDRTGFDTLAAGPSRSFAIHAFPNYTAAEWPGEGLSILDFGVVYKGYTSDTTVTIAKGKLSDAQEKQLALVQKAYDECLKLYTKDHTIYEAAKKADTIFAAAKKKMPHTLGHGIGLEIHETPRVSTKTDSSIHFEPGMIVTLEPGLYDENTGGVRLENDVLITDSGNEVITHSRIIRIK